MEFWLIQDSERLRLPIPPPNYKIKTANNNSSFLVEGLGEVSFIGKTKLAEITPITTFFPKQAYDFCQYPNFPQPWDCVNMIEKWRLSGKAIRYIITNTFINILCSIESFEFGEDNGTGDISFTLELKEYRMINANTRIVNTLANGYQNTTFLGADITAATRRPIDKTIPTEYVVKTGENLFTIAKKLTGDSANYLTIANNNLIKDPLNIPVGTVIKL